MSDFNWLFIDHTGYVTMYREEWEALEAMQATIEYMNVHQSVLGADELELCTVAKVEHRTFKTYLGHDAEQAVEYSLERV